MYSQNHLDFKHFFAASPEMLCVYNSKGILLEANQSFLQGVGYSLEELKGKSLFEMVHLDDRKDLFQMYRLGVYENRFLCADQLYKWFSWSVVPDIQHEIFYAVVHNITFYKLQEKAMLEAINKKNEALDKIPDAFFVLDQEGCIVYLNNRAEELALRKKEEVYGKKIWDVIPQTINSVLYKEYQKIIADKSPRSFEAFHSVRGRWYELGVYPLEPGVMLYYHDITARKKAEVSLQLKNDIFYSNPSLMAVLTLPDLKIADINHGFLNNLGYCREDLLGQGVELLGVSFLTGGDLTFPEYLKEYGLIRNKEVIYETKTKEKRSGLLSVESFSQGEKQYLLLVINDLTDYMKEKKEEERFQTLQFASQVASGVAHEIRNPLTTISGLLQLMAKKKEVGHLKEYVDMVMAELQRVNHIIDDFLSLGRTSPYSLKLQNLEQLIKDTYPLLYTYALEYGKEVQLNLSTVPDLPLDSAEIRCLIVHLARNGLEAMSGKGRLIIETYLDGENVVLAFRDEGMGIPLDIQDKLGRPFFTTKDKSAGLGLAKCFSIAKRHGAQIRINTDQKGTVVYVIFNRK